MKQDATARDQLITEHMAYARKLTAKIRRDVGAEGLELEELLAYGIQGLVEAAERFDPGRGVAFTTFSYYRIRGSVFDGLRQLGWLGRADYARYYAASNEFLGNAAAREGTEESPSVENAAKELASTLDNLATIFVTSLEAEPRRDVPDLNLRAVDEAVADKQRSAQLRTAIGALADRERMIIELYYFQDLTLEQIGEKLGSSKSWTSRLHTKAVRQLTELMGAAFQPA